MHHLTLAILGYWGMPSSPFHSFDFFWSLDCFIYVDYIDVYGKICWKPLFYPQPPLLGARLCRGTVQARDRHPQHQKPGTNWQLLILKKIDGKAKSYHSVAYMNQFFISIPVMDGLLFYASILGKL